MSYHLKIYTIHALAVYISWNKYHVLCSLLNGDLGVWCTTMTYIQWYNFSFADEYIFEVCMICLTDCTCTLPMTDGVWYSSTRGDWLIENNGTTLSNFESVIEEGNIQLQCVSLQDSSKYILR